MSEKRKPWMKFYPTDWQADEGLSQCSLAARGLWIELIAVMHKSAVYGHLLIAGVRPTDQQIAVQVRTADVRAVTRCIAELEQWRVFDRTAEGVIVCRRMVKDAEDAERDASNGRQGGNPTLTGKPSKRENRGVNPPANPTDTKGDKAQSPESRVQKEDRPLPSVARGSDDCDAAVLAWNAMAAAHGLSQVARLTDLRRRHLRQRLVECGGLDGWDTALRHITESPFLLGQVREWKADFDFVLQPSSFAKLMEGAYGNRGHPSAETRGQRPSQAERVARAAGLWCEDHPHEDVPQWRLQ